VAEEDQAHVLDELANQDELYLSFYGDDLKYRFTKTVSMTNSSGNSSTN
jgi:hypothetical protein